MGEIGKKERSEKSWKKIIIKKTQHYETNMNKFNKLFDKRK